MSGPITDQAQVYYPYWDRILWEARIFGGLVIVELAVIVWKLWRG